MRNPRTTIAVIVLAAAATVGGVTVAVTAGGSIPTYSATGTTTSPAPAAANGAKVATLHTATATVQGTTERILVDAKGLPLYIY